MRLLPLRMSANPSFTSSASSAATWVIGLNAALQKRFIVDPSTTQQLIPGNVHRASSVSTGVGGKGQDVALTLHCLQYNRRAQTPFHVLQFIGTGSEGDTVYNTMLDIFEGDACFESTTIRTKSKMRTCTSIVTMQSTTELVEPSGIVLEAEIEAMIDSIRTINADASRQTSSKSLCFMGSMPPGCPPELYARIYRTIVHEEDMQTTSPTATEVRCLMDTVVGLEPLLQQIRNTPHVQSVLKINVAELGRYVKLAVPNGEEAEGAPVEFVVEAISEFWSSQMSSTSDTVSIVPNVIALTNGAHPAYLAVARRSDETLEKNTAYEFDLYRIPIVSPSLVRPSPDETADTAPLYPIGAGDAVAAGTLAAWNYYSQPTDAAGGPLLPTELRDILDARAAALSAPPIVAAFQWGLACGSASCVMEENSVVCPADVAKLYEATTAMGIEPPSVHLIPRERAKQEVLPL
jgi:fructose-1-phosphate kinase PfkB-like protein